jgi:hypothetical protein
MTKKTFAAPTSDQCPIPSKELWIANADSLALMGEVNSISFMREVDHAASILRQLEDDVQKAANRIADAFDKLPNVTPASREKLLENYRPCA